MVSYTAFLGLRAQVFQLMSLRTISETQAADESLTLVELGKKLHNVSDLEAAQSLDR